MRLPNGFGSVYKLKGKRRKPYVAKKTSGWTDDGKQQFNIIGYYATKKEAMEALTEYNKNPYNFEAADITFKEVFEAWKKQKYNKISKSAINGYNAAFATSEYLHKMKFVDIKTLHLQKVIDECGKGYDTLRKIKSLYNQLFKYAMKNDIVSKDYSSYVELKNKNNNRSIKPFTLEEVNKLFSVVDQIEYVDAILILIYTGMRVGELLDIKLEDVNLQEKTITGGKKTEAGRDRVIPIHKKIYPFIENRINTSKKYLIENKDKPGLQMTYDNFYRDHFLIIMDELGMEHRTHDCRKTLATLLSNAGANSTSIKRILGHSSYTITEKFYTHKDIEELQKAMDLI